MGDLFGIFKNFWEKEDYDRLTEVMVAIFVMIAPSFSFIFLYKRELFNSLDFTKLLILCLILNILFLYFTYIIEISLSIYKLVDSIKDNTERNKELVQITKELEKLTKELDEIEKIKDIKYKDIKVREIKKRLEELEEKNKKENYNANINDKKEMIKSSFLKVFLMVIGMWFLSIYDIIFLVDLSNQRKILRFVIYVLVLSTLYISSFIIKGNKNIKNIKIDSIKSLKKVIRLNKIILLSLIIFLYRIVIQFLEL